MEFNDVNTHLCVKKKIHSRDEHVDCLSGCNIMQMDAGCFDDGVMPMGTIVTTQF